MKHNPVWLRSAMLLLCLCSLSLHAQIKLIEGQLLSQDSVPLSYAQVQMLRPPYYLAVVQADSLGRFSKASQHSP